MGNPSLVSNMNFPAPVAILGFLAACGGLALSTLAMVVGAFVGKLKFAKPLLLVIAAGAAVYGGLLVGFSLVSHERILAQGQEKYFCEIDCHLAYSVVRVKSEPAENARLFSVTLRTRFDETTISPSRPREAPLTPNPRVVELIDAQGHAYPVVHLSRTPLTASLRPGESYFTELEFRVPSQASDLRLLLQSTGWPEHVLIGDERSPWHAKTWFGI